MEFFDDLISHPDGHTAELLDKAVEERSKYEKKRFRISRRLAMRMDAYHQNNSTFGFYLFTDNTNQRELIIRFPIWAPTVVVAPPFAWMCMGRYRRRRRKAKCHCVSCGYNLTGNISGKCPECGTPIARTTVRAK